MKKLIVSAFEPFGGSGRNSSLETLRALPEILYGYEIVKVTLPVVYGECGRLLCGKIAEYDPSEIAAVICLGLASGRGNIMPEYVAVNVRHGASADNAGVKYELTPIGDGADAYVTGLPVSDMVKKMKEAGVPAAVSFTAGTYVCNDVLYSALAHFYGTAVRAGFIHVPYLPEQAPVGVPSMPLSNIVRAIYAAIRAI
jgi:pyroglutamyl-peptidase